MSKKFIVKGTIIKDISALDLKTKDFTSKPFKDDREALKFAYGKVYRKDGNTKRIRNVLTDFQVIEY